MAKTRGLSRIATLVRCFVFVRNPKTDFGNDDVEAVREDDVPEVAAAASAEFSGLSLGTPIQPAHDVYGVCFLRSWRLLTWDRLQSGQ
jgi:hypothetical protein